MFSQSLVTGYNTFFDPNNPILLSLMLALAMLSAYKGRMAVHRLWYLLCAAAVLYGLVVPMSATHQLFWLAAACFLSAYMLTKIRFEGDDDDWRRGDDDDGGGGPGPRLPWNEFDRTRSRWERQPARF